MIHNDLMLQDEAREDWKSEEAAASRAPQGGGTPESGQL